MPEDENVAYFKKLGKVTAGLRNGTQASEDKSTSRDAGSIDDAGESIDKSARGQMSRESDIKGVMAMPRDKQKDAAKLMLTRSARRTSSRGGSR